MGPQRYPFGSALGFQNQFLYTVGPTGSGTAGLISGSTAPNVTLGGLFYLNNTGTLVIQNLLLDDTANRIASYEGKIVKLFILDTGSTVFSNGGALFMAGTNNLFGQNNSIDFMFSRGSWYETGRSLITRNEVITYAANVGSSVNVDGVRVVKVNNTGATTTSVIAFSGGQVGQEVSLMLVGSNAARVLEGGNIFIGLTNAVLINASGVYKFMKFDTAGWRTLAISSGGSI